MRLVVIHRTADWLRVSILVILVASADVGEIESGFWKMNGTTTKPIYRVITIPKPPFVNYDPDANYYSGLLIDLLNEIARRLNFQYEIEIQKESEYGFMDDEGNWNGLMRDLKEGKADIGLAAVSVMSERMKAVDFTEPIYKPTGISVLMQKPIPKTDFYR